MSFPVSEPRQDLWSGVEWLRSHARRQINRKADRSKVEELEAQVDKLTLYVATLFRILVTEKIVSQEDLQKLLMRLDEEDGQVDGTYRGRDPITGEVLPESNPFADLGS
ncbi:hypothetical protein [Tuwongella immobilis]|uniref:Uncharacterized protein n=1 Tax=Tuwongella immobilis TaxID=692036 RepID=A0A6C2YIZ9_9BACT|nr:hypothetical protein [Tuwongella immobilis]VIP01261.1 unnamed protein product [Tuwongella immobilis]VTR97948.1 unnamed protein product [Tuwongella immobilis]